MFENSTVKQKSMSNEAPEMILNAVFKAKLKDNALAITILTIGILGAFNVIPMGTIAAPICLGVGIGYVMANIFQMLFSHSHKEEDPLAKLKVLMVMFTVASLISAFIIFRGHSLAPDPQAVQMGIASLSANLILLGIMAQRYIIRSRIDDLFIKDEIKRAPDRQQEAANAEAASP